MEWGFNLRVTWKSGSGCARTGPQVARLSTASHSGRISAKLLAWNLANKSYQISQYLLSELLLFSFSFFLSLSFCIKGLFGHFPCCILVLFLCCTCYKVHLNVNGTNTGTSSRSDQKPNEQLIPVGITIYRMISLPVILRCFYWKIGHKIYRNWWNWCSTPS